MRIRNPNMHIEHCLRQKDLTNAISVSAKAIDEKNKIHDHQRRVGRTRFENFATLLVDEEPAIRQAETFEELFEIINSVNSPKIGELAKYDTATRLGAYKGLFPTKIYLHSGTRVGATRLLGNLGKKRYLTMQDLPAEMQAWGLSASEIEDILCIFKKDFL